MSILEALHKLTTHRQVWRETFDPESEKLFHFCLLCNSLLWKATSISKWEFLCCCFFSLFFFFLFLSFFYKFFFNLSSCRSVVFGAGNHEPEFVACLTYCLLQLTADIKIKWVALTGLDICIVWAADFWDSWMEICVFNCFLFFVNFYAWLLGLTKKDWKYNLYWFTYTFFPQCSGFSLSVIFHHKRKWVQMSLDISSVVSQRGYPEYTTKWLWQYCCCRPSSWPNFPALKPQTAQCGMSTLWW